MKGYDYFYRHPMPSKTPSNARSLVVSFAIAREVAAKHASYQAHSAFTANMYILPYVKPKQRK
jgi:hypothetical protein